MTTALRTSWRCASTASRRRAASARRGSAGARRGRAAPRRRGPRAAGARPRPPTPPRGPRRRPRRTAIARHVLGPNPGSASRPGSSADELAHQHQGVDGVVHLVGPRPPRGGGARGSGGASGRSRRTPLPRRGVQRRPGARVVLERRGDPRQRQLRRPPARVGRAGDRPPRHPQGERGDGCGQPIDRTSFPKCSPASSRRWASATSARGRTESITGVQPGRLDRREEAREVARAAHRGAEQRHLAHRHGPHPELHLGAARPAERHHPAARPHGGDAVRPCRADRVDHDVDAAPARELTHRADPVVLRVEDARLRPEVPGAVELVLRRRRHDHPAARGAGEHRRDRGDAAADAEHQDGLAGPDPGAAHERPVGGEPRERERRRLLPRQARRLGEHVLRREPHQLGVGAVVGAAEDAEAGRRGLLAAAPAERRVDDHLVALAEAGHAVADRPDRPRAVRSGDDRQRARRDALAQEHVPPVQRRRPERDHHLARARRRVVRRAEPAGPPARRSP